MCYFIINICSSYSHYNHVDNEDSKLREGHVTSSRSETWEATLKLTCFPCPVFTVLGRAARGRGKGVVSTVLLAPAHFL